MPTELVAPGSGVWGEGSWGTGVWGGGGDVVYTFPSGIALKENTFEQRIEKSKRIFSDGRMSFGEEVDDRDAVLEGLVDADTRLELLALLDDMRYRCQGPNQRLRINSGHFLNVAKLSKFEDEPERGFDRTVSRLRIVWQCDDPFWYSESLQSQSVSMAGNGTFTIDLSALPKCLRGQHPLITVTAPVYLPLPTFTLANTTDGGLQFRYADPLLTLGKSALIDCAAGTVVRDGASSIRYFDGEFLRLVPGVNTFTYTGTACTLLFSWRHRWL